MRLWSLHPKYLDAQGLVALWREALLAQKVLRGETKGYRSHPQLIRFLAQPRPQIAISAYLHGVHEEASRRGYSFDESKIGGRGGHAPILVSSGQLEYEWRHLRTKLLLRSPSVCEKWRDVSFPECHPLFQVIPGGIELWERERAT